MQDIGKVISAGEPVSNVYYDHKSTHLAKLADDVLTNNRFTQTFSSMQFGAQGISLLIPNDQLVGDTIIALRFAGAGDTTTNRLGLVPVAAYAAIKQIEYQIGGSVVYQNSGIQHMFAVLADCESMEKRDEVIALAGGAGFKAVGFASDTTFYAHIKVPWSNIDGIHNLKNPLDSKLVQQPLRVNIYLQPANYVYYTAAGTVTSPTALVDAYFQVHQFSFLDSRHNLKLKYETMENGQLVVKNDFYSYPFSFYQDFQTSNFAGSVVGNAPLQIPLTGFRSGNLLAIRFMLFNQSTAPPLTFPADGNTNILRCEDPLNVSLFFNGLEIFRSRYDSWKMSNLECQFLPNFGRMDPNGTSKWYWVEMPLSQYSSEVIGAAYQKGLNVSSQTLILQLNTLLANNYTILGSYIYHSDVVMDGSTAEISFS